MGSKLQRNMAQRRFSPPLTVDSVWRDTKMQAPVESYDSRMRGKQSPHAHLPQHYLGPHCDTRIEEEPSREALIYSTYPSPHCMRVSLRPSGEGRLAACLDAGAQRYAHTVRPQPLEFK